MHTNRIGPPDAPGVATAAVQAAAVVLALFVLQFVAPTSAALGGSLLSRALPLLRMVAVVALATWFLRRSGQSWADVGLRRPTGWKRITLLALLGLPAIVLVLKLVLMPAFARLGVAPPDIAAFTRLEGDWLEWAYWAFPTALGSAAFGEEMIARGFLMNRLERMFATLGRGAAPAAALAQAAIFGAAHYYQGLGGVLQAGSVGLMFAIVFFLGRRNLWPCIFLHGLFDFVSVTSLFLGAKPG